MPIQAGTHHPQLVSSSQLHIPESDRSRHWSQAQPLPARRSENAPIRYQSRWMGDSCQSRDELASASVQVREARKVAQRQRMRILDWVDWTAAICLSDSDPA